MCRLWVPPRRTRVHPWTKPIFFLRGGVSFCFFPFRFFGVFLRAPVPCPSVPCPSVPPRFTMFRYHGLFCVFIAPRSFVPKINLNIAYQHMRDYPRPTKLAPNKLPQIHRAAYCVFTALVQILSK